jgi:hypothetical protein
MAVLNVLVDRRPDDVWEVLSDGSAYGQWVMGARQTGDIDPRWPEVGAAIQYAAGFGPLSSEDVTIVRLMDPGRRLELEARAGRFGTARISIELLPWGDDGTVVIMDEHPLSGPGARWHSLAVEGLLRFRNDRMLRTLAQLVRDRHPH